MTQAARSKKQATASREEPSTVRRIARTATDVAIGGTALVADEVVDAVDEIVERAGGAMREGRREARETAADATRALRKTVQPSDGRAYEDRTRDELYALAAEREIAGRSSMRKAELIEALRKQH